MKLTPEATKALDTLLQTANAVGIEKLIIGNGLIRGADEKKTVAVVTDKGVPDLDGKSMTINRIKQFLQRLNLAKSQGELQLEATVAPNGADVSLIEIVGGKSKSQFRCASLEAVKGVPKGMSDPAVWVLKVASKMVPIISQAEASLDATGVTLASKDGKTVSVELVDTVNKDVVSIELEDEATWIGSGNAATSFVNKYTTKALLGLLREASKDAGDTIELRVGQGGLLMINVAGVAFCTLPHTA
jgi:hypothetical protein